MAMSPTNRGSAILAVLAWAFLSVAAALPHQGDTTSTDNTPSHRPHEQGTNSSTECSSSNINTRRSWNAFSDDEKREYIAAELCLMAAPPRSGTPGARNRWDELQYNHIIQGALVHHVGAFLPWHRYFVRVHEDLLQTECGYTGSQPYWDELGDQAAFPDVPVLDPDTGFGGNGQGDSQCLVDGPFRDHVLHFGPHGSQDYCISRALNRTQLIARGNETRIDECFAAGPFADAWPCYEKDPHGAGHAAISGIMGNVSTSPGDPLFFLHHAYLDKLWWEWQLEDLPLRLTEVDGPRLPNPQNLEKLGSSLLALDSLSNHDGNGAANLTTLNHNLWMRDIRPNVTIRDVMNLRGQTICAQYE